MRHLQTWFKNGYDYSCLAQCYLYAVADHSRIKLTERQAELYVIGGLLLGAGLGEDFFVNDPVSLMRESWHNYSDEWIYPNVIKKSISSLDELKTIEYAAVEYKYNNRSHFVLMKYGLLEYNGLEDSQCFKYGRPVSARIITFKA